MHGPISITGDNAHVGSGSYNPPISFCELSLDGTGHMIQIGEWLSEDIRRTIWYPSPDSISTEEKPRNEQSETIKLSI